MPYGRSGKGGGGSASPLPNQDSLLKLGVSVNNRLTINGVEQTAGTPSAAKPLNGKRWHTYGDSITALGGANTYSTLVGAEQGLTVTNRGKSGWITYGSGSGNGIAELLTVTDNPVGLVDLITFTGGTNHSGTVNLGVMGDTTLATVYGSLNVVVQWCFTNNVKLIFLTPIQYGIDRVTTGKYGGAKNARQAILDTAAYYSIPVLDWWAISGITLETSSRYLTDGIHPNAEGYRVMSAHLSKFISNLVV